MSNLSRAKIQTRNSQRLAEGKWKAGKSILHRPAERYRQLRDARSKSPKRYPHPASTSSGFKEYSDSPPQSAYDSIHTFETPTIENKLSSTLNLDTEEANHLLEILKKLSMDQFLPIFNANHVTMEDLPLLSKQDLIDMKLPIGPRNRLMKFLEEIRQENSGFRQLEQQETIENTEQMTEEEYLEEYEDENQEIYEASRGNSTQDEIFEVICRQNKCKNLEEMLLQISNQQLDMMKVIAQQQKAIKLLSNVTYIQPQSPVSYDPDEDTENIPVERYDRGSANSSLLYRRSQHEREEASTSPYSRLKRRTVTYDKPTLNSTIRKKVMPSKFMRVSPLRVAYRLKNMQ